MRWQRYTDRVMRTRMVVEIDVPVDRVQLVAARLVLRAFGETPDASLREHAAALTRHDVESAVRQSLRWYGLHGERELEDDEVPAFKAAGHAIRKLYPRAFRP